MLSICRGHIPVLLAVGFTLGALLGLNRSLLPRVGKLRNAEAGKQAQAAPVLVPDSTANTRSRLSDAQPQKPPVPAPVEPRADLGKIREFTDAGTKMPAASVQVEQTSGFGDGFGERGSSIQESKPSDAATTAPAAPLQVEAGSGSGDGIGGKLTDLGTTTPSAAAAMEQGLLQNSSQQGNLPDDLTQTPAASVQVQQSSTGGTSSNPQGLQPPMDLAPQPSGLLEDGWKKAPFDKEPRETSYAVTPSDISAALMSKFQVCGKCPGEPRSIGRGIAFCPEIMKGVQQMNFYGAKAWTEFGVDLAAAELDWPKTVAVFDCHAKSETIQCPSGLTSCSVHFEQKCFYEQMENPFPPDMERLTPKNSDKVVGIFNADALEWRLLHEAKMEPIRQHRLLVIKFFWLEQQAKHLLYLEVMEKLLKHFRLVSVSGSPCHGRWHIPGSSLVMPRVLWATFVRKDIGTEAECRTDIQMAQECQDASGGGDASSGWMLLSDKPFGEPTDLFYEVFEQSYYAQDPDVTKHIIPYKPVSLDFLRTFRLCHGCAKGSADLLRIGPNMDGGYLICREAALNAGLAISIGIRGSDPFGAELSEQFDVQVHGFDCTGVPYRCPGNLKKCRFTHHSQCVGKPFGGKSPDLFMTFDEILTKYATGTEDPILKIDCEGCEWSVLPEVPLDVLRRFRMIVMEAHWLEKQERHYMYLKTMRHVLEAFDLVHSHACNVFGVWTVNGTGFGMPRIVELLFVRRDYAVATECTNSTYRKGLDVKIMKYYHELFADSFRLPPP